MKKKKYLILTIMIMGLFLVSCGKKSEQKETQDYGKISLMVPDEFTQSTTKGLYFGKDYPQDGSNIYIYSSAKSENFEEEMRGGQESFVDYLKAAYYKQYQVEPEITLNVYRQVMISNHVAYEIELSYEYDQKEYYQLEYIIDADKTYYVAYSQIGPNDWMDAFRESAQSIVVNE